MQCNAVFLGDWHPLWPEIRSTSRSHKLVTWGAHAADLEVHDVPYVYILCFQETSTLFAGAAVKQNMNVSSTSLCLAQYSVHLQHLHANSPPA